MSANSTDHPVVIDSTFLNAVRGMPEVPGVTKRDFGEEFDGVVQLAKQHSSVFTKALDYRNRWKNRYGNVLPTDDFRVVLKPRDKKRMKYDRMQERKEAIARSALTASSGLPSIQLTVDNEDSGSDDEVDYDLYDDYINASWVTPYEGSQKYISTQAPLPNTVEDFWRLVSQEQSTVIIMLTCLVENNRIKAHQYWPKKVGDSLKYTEFTLEFKSEHSHKHVCVRKFRLVPRTDNIDQAEAEPLIVRQLQFMDWPDHGVPDDPVGLEDLIRRTDMYKGSLDTPIIVHCSAGIGRSGTFIAVHSSRQKAVSGKDVDIGDAVVNMRRCRPGMIQVQEQYEFAHRAVDHALRQRPSAKSKPKPATPAGPLYSSAGYASAGVPTPTTDGSVASLGVSAGFSSEKNAFDVSSS
jgi:protein tyrosine phosphatase